MKKFTLFMTMFIAFAMTAFAQVDYTPTNVTAINKTRNDRNLTSVKVGTETYELSYAEQALCYVDKYADVVFTVEAGQEVALDITTPGSWTHGSVYVDFDNNGFTAGVTENWKPTGDLVAYAFYNNDSSSDASGWNSVGTVVSGDNRNRPAIPSYTIPAETPVGEYRIRFKLDWCNIDPNGDADGKFGDFMENGGQIVDAKLVVNAAVAPEPEPEPEQPEANVVYSLTETRLTSSDLMSKTEPTLIAIKNLSKTNNYWFVGNTGAAPYSAAEFSEDAVFVWEPVVEGVAGVYCLKKLDGTYMTSASPTTFSAESGAAAPFTTTNPTTGNGFNGDGDSKPYIDDEALLVRFVTGGKWINVQNGDAGIPVYNNGDGGWTIHNVYLVEKTEETVEPEPEPEPEPEQPTNELVLDLTAAQVGTSYPYQLSDEDAAKVYALSDITIAVRFNTTSLSGRQALFATADPTKAANTDAMGANSYYVAYGMNNADLGYLASWKDGDRYTAGNCIPSNTEGNIAVYVINPTNNNFRSYLNGENIADRNFGTYEIASPAMVKADYPDANIYIGGAMNASGVGEVFNGQITGVKVFNGALSEDEIAAITFDTVEPEPELPALEITGYTPTEAVEKLETITITFNDEIEGTFDMMAMSQIYLGSRSNGCSFAVEGNVLTITPFNAITTSGEYGLVIPEGLITRKSNGEKISLNKEIVFTVKAPLAALEITGYTPTEAVESLETITITFNDEIEGTFDTMAMNRIYLGSRSNNCSYVVKGNVLTITPINAITTPGEYGLVIPAGLITRKSNGEKISLNKEIVFTVEEPVVIVNTMEIADATVNAGEQVILSFNMKNDTDISCYQCDLYLPDGMSVATDNYGNKLINVSYERTTPSRHRCSYSELPDGGIRILSYSTNNYTFIGNEGEVLTVTVNVDSDVDNGDYTVMLCNIEMTQPDETYYITELTTATVSVYTEIPGDINGDRYHTIADVQAIVNLILTGVKAVDYPKADVNGDNRISITDLQAIVNLVLYQKSYAATHGTAKRAKRNYESENSLYIEPFSISAGEEKQVLIKLDNPSDAFSALQFDLYLPEGIDVATDNSSLALGSRTDDFNHNHPMSAYQEDGALRVICYSNSSSEFSNTSGDVITITLTAAPDLVDGSYDIEIRNVELARRDATADRPADTTTRVSVDSWTGISDMADDGAEVEVYDVYGRKVTKAEKRGIYIVNGKKVFNK